MFFAAFDFQVVAGQELIFASNETEHSFTIRTKQDRMVETPEKFTVVVSSRFSAFNNETVNVTIVDNGQG